MPIPLDAGQIERVHTTLLDWFAEHGSHDLPWRKTRDPYAVLVSEFMLQQTQRERVAPKFVEFMGRFPTLAALALAPASAVIRAWSGLGYNSRALRLHTIARAVMAGSGSLPATVAELRALPGVGDYTAGAVACFGFGQAAAFVDTNVRRVLARIFLGDLDPRSKPKRDQALAESALSQTNAWEWNSALMDLGARLCMARSPRCTACPLRDLCRAERLATTSSAVAPLRRVAEPQARYTPRASGAQAAKVSYAASDRFLRGRIVEALRNLAEDESYDLRALALAATGMSLPPQDSRVEALTERLVFEGLVAAEDTSGSRRYRLPD